MAIQSINPASGETLARFLPHSEQEIERKVERASFVFRTYKRTTLRERAGWMGTLAEVLEGERDKWATLMTREMGKLIGSAREEIDKCALTCRYFAEHAEEFLADRSVVTGADRGFIRFQPMGVILAVMPWNFPFWQVFRFAAPALMAGNVALLKHASNVPQCSLAIETIFDQAGFPPGVFQSLLISGERADQLMADERVVAATLTGSESAGSGLAVAAGRQVKKTVLELGGSDPFIVARSAPLPKVVERAVFARMINSGQSCIASKRFIVVAEIVDEFTRLFADAMKALKVGDPLDTRVQVGPLAQEIGLRMLEGQVQDAIRQGAHVICGARRLDRRGYYYEPTILADFPRSAAVFREEVFGPVALLYGARDLEDAFRLANESRFGLGASFWSQDVGEQERFVEEIEAGVCSVNGTVISDPRLPFGGIKRSGYGRELGEFGIREFSNIKSVWIKNEI